MHLSCSAKEKHKSVKQLVRNIYLYFAHSSKRVKEIVGGQVFSDETLHKIIYPSYTRWLSQDVGFPFNFSLYNSPSLLSFQEAVLKDILTSSKSIFNAKWNSL